MQNYSPRTIVPVGTKVIRTKYANWVIEIWAVYTVSNCDKWFILLEWLESTWRWDIENFAPYEEAELEDTSTVPTYVTLKEMPYISKGSVIVKWKETINLNLDFENNLTVVQNNINSIHKLDSTQENFLLWILENHPENFKKIN